MSIRRISESDTRPRSPEASSLAGAQLGLPSTSSGQRVLQTKAKTRDGRLRAASSGAAYPQARVEKAKAARSKSKPADDDDDEPKKRARGPDGRFTKS